MHDVQCREAFCTELPGVVEKEVLPWKRLVKWCSHSSLLLDEASSAVLVRNRLNLNLAPNPLPLLGRLFEKLLPTLEMGRQRAVTVDRVRRENRGCNDLSQGILRLVAPLGVSIAAPLSQIVRVAVLVYEVVLVSPDVATEAQGSQSELGVSRRLGRVAGDVGDVCFEATGSIWKRAVRGWIDASYLCL